jgi:hypothetical protein
MNFIDRLIASSSCDLAALGHCVAGLELTGTGVKNQPQRMIIGAGGAQLIDAAHVGRRAMEYGPMGIKVVPNNPITVNYWMLGIDAGTMFAGVGFGFSPRSNGPTMLWQSQEVVAADIDVNVQFQNWAAGAAGVMPVPAESKKIGYIMTGAGGDQLALGSGGAMAFGTGNGLVNTQEFALGGNAGELVIGAGYWNNAGFHRADFDVRSSDSISWFARMVGEETGNVACGIAVGFIV